MFNLIRVFTNESFYSSGIHGLSISSTRDEELMLVWLGRS